MFTKPLDQLKYADIEEFCQEHSEGESVEYTAVMPTGGKKTKNIPKIVSAFANTSGGYLLIGVKIDDNNKPIIPIEGIPNQTQIEERLSGSASEGVYPPVPLDVGIVDDIPNHPDNVVVVVRVNESQQSPHAIEKFTKVHVRIGSTTPLASIFRIEYMFNQRDQSQENSNEIEIRIEKRIASRWPSPGPNITVRTRPAFPDRRLISAPLIYEYIKDQDRCSRSRFPLIEGDSDSGTRQVTGGVCHIGGKSRLWYHELNERGIVYYANQLHKSRYEAFHGPEDNEENRYLRLRDLVREISTLILIAKDFYAKCEYLGEIQVAAQVRNVLGEKLMFGGETHYSSIQRQESLEPAISASAKCHALDLIEFEKSADVIVELIAQLAWGFNAYDDSCEGAVRNILDRFSHEWE